MSLDAGADVEVGLGGFSLETLVGIRAGLDGLKKTIRAIHDIEEAYQFGAVELPLRGGATSDSGGDTLVIGLGGPASQRLWQLRRLVVGGSLYSDSVDGTAIVVVSSNHPSSTPPLADVVDQAATLPLPATYSTGQIVIRHPNRLWVVFLSPSESTNYAVGGAVTDMPDKRERIDVER